MQRQSLFSDSSNTDVTKSLVLARAFDEDRIINPSNPFPSATPDGTSGLSRYFYILRRSWILIASLALLSTALVVFGFSRLSPVFESSSTVSVDVQAAPGFIGQESQRPISVTDSDQILSTQVNLLQADSVLRAVNAKLNFTPEELGYKSFLKNGHDIREAPIQLKSLTVKRVPSTYLIKVAFRSNDSNRAAEVANAVAASYLARNFSQRLQSSSDLSSFMDKQLAEMKTKMEQSSASLAQYEKDLDIVNPEQKTNIVSARLLQLNEAYTDAQAQRISKEAAYDSAKVGTLAAVETYPQVDLLRRLEEKRNTLQSNFTVTAQTYGKKHANYKSAQAELDQVEAQIKTAQLNIVERARLEFRQSESNEQTLLKAVNESKRESDHINSSSFAYQQLRRDAENDRKLYEDLQRRIREAGLNSAFQNSSIRLSDLARASILPVFPNLPLIGAAAFFCSSILGYLGVLIFHSIRRTVYGSADIIQNLGVPVLGTLPRVKASARDLDSKAEWAAGLLGQSVPIASLISGKRSPTSVSFSESIRSIHNTILANSAANKTTTILVTSALPREGKSTTALALALSHSSRNKPTLLIDADIRRPSLSANNGDELGLADFLVGDIRWQSLVQALPRTPNLDFLPAGKNSQRACDHLHHIQQLVEEAREHFELIVIDCSPVLCFADAAQISALVDKVVLVSRAPDSNLSTLELALENLYIAGARLAGVVMNEVDDTNLKVGYTKYARNYSRATTS